MQSCISISSKKDLAGLRKSLIDFLPRVMTDSVYTKELQRGGSVRYFLMIEKNPALPHEKISAFIGKWIIKNYEKKIATELFDKIFIDFESDVSSEVLEYFNEKNNEKQLNENIELISNEIETYLKDENSLYIDGFIKFRLKKYKKTIRDILYEIVNELCCEREYLAFVKLVREYMDMQMSCLGLLHIKPERNGNFLLFDFKRQKIKFDNRLILGDDLIEGGSREEDKLLGFLLSVNPKRIIWHDAKEVLNESFVNTIKDIFGDRFTLCYGCRLCDE